MKTSAKSVVAKSAPPKTTRAPDRPRAAGIDRSDITAHVTELESRLLVERSPDPEDRRRNIVALTAEGRARLDELDVVLTDVQDQVLAPLNAAERRRFLELLRRLTGS